MSTSLMGALQSVLDNWTDRHWWGQVFRNKPIEWFIQQPASAYINYRYGPRTDHFKEDWDNLILLDACRYDIFAEMHNLPGRLESRLSVGTATMEWLHKTVKGESFLDTVYITGNPRVSRFENQFHDVIPLWETAWDHELKVTPPRPITDAALTAYDEYPNKRIVVHFMQPHIPFIGDDGQQDIGSVAGTQKGRKRELGDDVRDKNWTEPYDLLEQGELSRETVKHAYRENLSEVLPHVEQLVTTFEEKTIVSSDHGEMFGELGWPIPMRLYGHPQQMPALNLIKVPWLVINSNTRKQIVAEGPQNTTQSMNHETIAERLRHLGYANEEAV